MKNIKIILALIFACLAGICHAQLPPPRVITHTFSAPELQVDSVFIDSLNTILFDPTRNAADFKPSQHFYIDFEQKDSLNYSIIISLGDHPSRKSTGFFERDGYLYWLYDGIPPNIVLGTGPERQFSYNEYITAIADVYDPLTWFLIYNSKTGGIKKQGRGF